MIMKRRRFSGGEVHPGRISKRVRTRHHQDHFTSLQDEILIKILHHLPLPTLLQCQRLSHRIYALTSDSQLWKNLYYTRFVLPRALRIPGIKTAPPEHDALKFSSRRSRWLDDNGLVHRADGKVTDWKRQYKLRHNWAQGACEVQAIHVGELTRPSMLVRLAEKMVITADEADGLRAWDLKDKIVVATCQLEGAPTCLTVGEKEGQFAIAMGFLDGSWGTWKLDVQEKTFTQSYRHPKSSNGHLSAVAYSHPYVLTTTDAQLLSLYTFGPKPDTLKDVDDQGPEETFRDKLSELVPKTSEEADTTEEEPSPNPHLLASLQSHTSWPPISLSIRSTPTTLIASIAYSLPTYLSGYTIGLQELHISLLTSTITLSRLASALPQGFSSLSQFSTHSPRSPSSPSSHVFEPRSLRDEPPSSLSYTHPYILATHPDNTLSLHLCTSTSTALTISPAIKLWGHTSAVASASITSRGKAVSVAVRGGELRVWELEGTSSPSSVRRRGRGVERSVRVQGHPALEDVGEELAMDGSGDKARKEKVSTVDEEDKWVGFDEEVVVVLKECTGGTRALMIYDFT